MIGSSGRAKSWVNYVVRVNLGPRAFSSEFRTGLTKLKKIETWLQKNHLPLALMDEFGKPKSEIVTVFFDAGDSAKALAFKGFCSELGIASTLQSQRVKLNRDWRVQGY